MPHKADIGHVRRTKVRGRRKKKEKMTKSQLWAQILLVIVIILGIVGLAIFAV